jgi:2'-5' RNA ligase
MRKKLQLPIASDRAIGFAMIYVLAYPEFEPQTALKIDCFRSSHEPDRAKLVPPHITLVFGLRDANKQEFLSFCEAAVERVPELAVSFSHSEVAYDPFEKTYKLFLICNDGKDVLIRLHRQLYDGPHSAEIDTTTPYKPHMTVASNADPSRIAQLDTSDIGAFPILGLIRSLKVVKVAEGRLNTLGDVALSA